MKRRKLLIGVTGLALLLIFIGALAWYALPGSKALKPKGAVPSKGGSLDAGLQGRVNVLLVGADQRPEESKYNTDSLILASIDPQTQHVYLLSIPRDTRVELDRRGYVKINAVAALAGLPQLEQVVADLAGVPVNGYIATNFAGFKEIIDTLGGITVDVEKDMYYETGDQEDGIINLHKGVQRLNGSQALQYARFRHDALADISRTARQQVVLKAIAKEIFQVSTIPKLPVLIPQLKKAVDTDLSAADLLKLARTAAGFQGSAVVSQTLPGRFLDLNGVSYWEVDPAEAKEVVANLWRGITTDKVINDETIDLLKPPLPTPAKPLPKVPGNSADPNGQQSPSYHDVQWPADPGGGA